jgi:hypothetical protein
MHSLIHNYSCGFGALVRGTVPAGHGAAGVGCDVVCGGFPAEAGAAPGITGVEFGAVLFAFGEFVASSP